MKKLKYVWLIICLTLLPSACAADQPGDTTEEPSQGPTWQEQYDLGVRYLSEGNYEEAIIAFTAAIEIDPKQAPAYVGRGDAYVKSGETEENLAAALADYEKAVELDETSVEAYLGLADVYIRQGDVEKALETLRKGYEITEDTRLQAKEGETKPQLTNEYGAVEFTARDTFISAENLSVDQINIINTLIEALTQNNRAAFESIVRMNPRDDVFGTQRTIYTLVGEYKVKIWSPPFSWITIEIRPENGLGYYGGMRISNDPADGKIHEELGWWYSVCLCFNWQPNGTYQKYYEGQFSDGDLSSEEKIGTAVQGRCTGIETCVLMETGRIYNTSETEYDDSGKNTQIYNGEMWGMPLSEHVTEYLEDIWW